MKVLDLRSMVPRDRDVIIVAPTITEYDQALLRHVSRVCVPGVPIPSARKLEYAVLPTAVRIEAAIRKAAAA